MDNELEKKTTLNLINSIELDGFKEKTDQLMSSLENNDISSAMKCINEINAISGKNFYSTIGKLTRGLHDAVSDLSISSSEEQPENNKTRVDLNYVINLTADAAKKTLDMTEQSTTNIRSLSQRNSEQATLIENYLSNHTPDLATTELLSSLSTASQHNTSELTEINKNVGEIVMAQNYQDIASQSITKAITIIKEVEDSLVALTQHANLLSKLSNFSEEDGTELKLEDSDALKNNIGQMNESEHLDQGDVDSLLSSLGF